MPSSSTRPSWQKALVGLLVASLCLAALEGLVRLLGGPPAPFLVAPIPSHTVGFLQEEEGRVETTYQLEWKIPPFSVQPDRPRVAWLGGSSVRGGNSTVPLEMEAPALVGQALGIEVLNLGAPGLDTRHLLGLTKELLRYQPQVLVIYSGHNDLGNAVFFQRHGDLRGALTMHGRALMGGLRTFQLLEEGLTRSEVADLPDPDAQGKHALDASRRAEVRRHYAARIRRIILMAREAGIEVVLSTVISNPFARPRHVDCPAAFRSLDLPAGGTTNYPLSAVDPVALADQRRQFPDCRQLRWLDEAIKSHKTNSPASQEVLDELRDQDPEPLQADRATVDLIRSLASEHGAHLADVNRQARALGMGIEPEHLFVDELHLTAPGQATVASVVAPVVARLLDLPDPQLTGARATPHQRPADFRPRPTDQGPRPPPR